MCGTLFFSFNLLSPFILLVCAVDLCVSGVQKYMPKVQGEPITISDETSTEFCA